MLVMSITLSAQVKPNNFTEETAPDNANFEVYSQKSGVNRKASLLGLKKYFAPSINVGAIAYVPAATGNSSADWGEFVVDPDGDTWYIDMTGRSFLIYANSDDQGVTDAYLSTDNDTLFIVTVTDTVIVPGLSDLDDQGFTIDDYGTFYTLNLSGTNSDAILREGSNITMEASGDTITISASGGTGSTGETNEGENLGAGAEVFKEKSDTTFMFRTLEDAGIVTVTQGTNDITISATEVDGSTTNEIQTITISNDTIYLSDGGFVVVPGASDDQAITVSNDTIYLEDGGFVVIPPTDFGSGTDDRIAYWSSNALTSTVWEISPTYIRGSATGWPHLEDALFTYRGDTDTGMKRVAANNLGLYAGSASVPFVSYNGSVVNFCYDNVATDWQMYSTGFVSINNYFPSLKLGTVDFTGDTDTKISRLSADILGLHAGDVTNPMLKLNGPSDAITFDVNDDTTVEATLDTDGLELAGTLTVNTFASSPATDALAGFNSNNTVTAVTKGTGLDITSNVASVSLPRLFIGDTNVGSSQSFSISSSTYDTIALTTTFQQEKGITYGAPNPSADSAIIFPTAGAYEVTLTFSGELSTAGTNQTVKSKWFNMGSSAVINGSAMSWGFETTARQTYTQTFQVVVSANDAIQLLLQSGTGGAATLTVATPYVSVKYIAKE